MSPKQVSPYMKKKNTAERERWEREQHQDNKEIIVALNRVARDVAALRDQEHRYEAKKGIREWLTIASVASAAVAAIITIIVNHGDTRHTLKDTGFAADRQHSDTLAALERAKVANDQAGRLADIAREAEAHQLRAYVYSVVTSPLPKLVATAENFFAVNFINGGETPAYDPGGELSWGYLPMPITKPLEQFTKQNTTTLQRPAGFYLFKDRTDLLTSNIALILSEEQIDYVKQGRAIIYFMGQIIYKDIFSCRRHTRFCVYYAVNDGREIPRDCPTYNDVDDPNKCDKD
jgi:hypothetical protein